MIDDQFNPEEQQLIERLANAPQPSLNPAAFEMIRGRVLDAVDNPPALPELETGAPTGITLSTPVIIAAIVLTVIIGSIIAIVFISRPQQPVVMPTPTSLPTSTPLPPTATLTTTPTALPTVIPNAAATTGAPATATITPSLTSTLTETPTTISLTSTPSPAPVIVVEGPIQTINDNVITIYDIPITLDPNNPLLPTLQVGDIIHVEADYLTDVTIIVAVTVEVVDDDIEVNVNPSNGETWSDNGNCDNPPPDWAPANGWRRRCQGATGNGNNGNGNGNDDD